MRLPNLLGLVSFLLVLTSCDAGKLERIPSIDYQANFGTPAEADTKIRSFASEHGFALRDTMIGIDGYAHYLVGKDGVIVIFLPSVDCPHPTSNEYWMKVTLMPEYRNDKWSAVQEEAANLTRALRPQIKERQPKPCLK